MSYAHLRAEILAEFAAFVPGREWNGYGLRTSADERRAYDARWRKDNAAWIASPEFRARAVANTKRWRAEQNADPVKRSAWLAKRRAAAVRRRAARRAP